MNQFQATQRDGMSQVDLAKARYSPNSYITMGK